MKRFALSPAVAGALALSLPSAALAGSFQDCTYDCRATYQQALGLCAGKTGELLRTCRDRAEKTFSRCTRSCTLRENQRLRLEQARQREAEQRRKLRDQPR